jgi:electron transport complex protein RnfG
MRITVKIISLAVPFLGAFAAFPGTVPVAAAAKGVLYDQDKILREFFPGADDVRVETVHLTPELCARLKARLGYVPVRADGTDAFPLFIGRKAGRDLGYAVLDEEKGMHEPISFAVLIGLDGVVQRQEVMVYREPEGDGVTSKRFSGQFIGKTIKDPIRAGMDIQIVSSATISSNSMAVGVRRAVALVAEGILAARPVSAAAPAEAATAAAPASASTGTPSIIRSVGPVPLTNAGSGAVFAPRH